MKIGDKTENGIIVRIEYDIVNKVTNYFEGSPDIETACTSGPICRLLHKISGLPEA